MTRVAPDAVAVAGVVLIVALVLLVVGVLARIARLRQPPGQPTPPPTSALAWLGAAGAGVVLVALGVFQAPLLILLASYVGLSVGAVGLSRLMARYGLIARLARRADRGDLDGAIARLEAVVARRPPPAAAAPAAPFDPAAPYAPPVAPLAAAGDPRLAARLTFLGILHARRGDWPAALGCFERADRDGGGEPIYGLNRGEALIMLGNPAEGLDVAAAAIDRVPAGDHLKQHQLHLSLARTLLDAGHRAAAADALDRSAAALRQTPALLAPARARCAAEIEAARARLVAPAAAPAAAPAPRTDP